MERDVDKYTRKQEGYLLPIIEILPRQFKINIIVAGDYVMLRRTLFFKSVVIFELVLLQTIQCDPCS